MKAFIVLRLGNGTAFKEAVKQLSLAQIQLIVFDCYSPSIITAMIVPH